MIKKLRQNKINTARQIIGLQKQSYQLEAKLIDFKDLPPMKETIEQISQCREIFYGYYLKQSLSGVISYHIEGSKLFIDRVAVHPQALKKGIATALLLKVMQINRRVDQFIVTTALRNTPAIRLYLKLGFTKTVEFEVEPGLILVTFEKKHAINSSLPG